jgi:proteasome assembly chaperone (PAC2) family protein
MSSQRILLVEDFQNDEILTLSALKDGKITNEVDVVKPIDQAEFAKAIERVGLYWLIVNAVPKSKG